ncbi:MAG TPA: hypothetical protein VNQ99_11170 [Xanthobacteraceae bacterium]|nr:hypothetical protein [Xanthobacteraceae bacterium]
MKRPGRPFTPADDDAIRRGRRAGHTYNRIAQDLGRGKGIITKRAIRLGIWGMKPECVPLEPIPPEPRVEAHLLEPGNRVKTTREQEIDRQRRIEATHRRTLTQEVFGDPPPGFSALDRRGK